MRKFNNFNASLILIPTPIGNLGDVTRRAIEYLSSVDIIFCEDTRRAKTLLANLTISKPVQSLHSHNERQQIEKVLEFLERGDKVAYISDSGTPGISDPGIALVRSAQESGFSVMVLPGAAALVPAVVMSGLPCDKFIFLGFSPASNTKRRRLLRELADFPYSIVFYEAPHRIAKMLKDSFDILGNRNCAVVREISKIHEEVLQGTLEELIACFAENKPRGEIVLVIQGNE